MNKSDGCKCHSCKKFYKVDIMVPEDIWDKIRPEGSTRGAGLLCGSCIMERIKSNSNFSAYKLIEL